MIRSLFISLMFFLPLGTAVGAGERVIQVVCPTGPGHELYVRGEGAGLSWDPSDAKKMVETPPGSGLWEIRLPAEGRVEFKVLVGNQHWMRGNNQVLNPGENRKIEEPKFEFPRGSVVEDQVKAPPKTRDGPQDDTRTVRVYRPAGFDHSRAEKYPLVIALDGQDFFGSGGGKWAGQENLDQAIGLGLIKPSVAIAVDHAGRGRVQEYTTLDPNRHPSGGANGFSDWMTSTLLPYAANQVHADTRPESVTGIGSSMAATAWIRITTRTGLARKLILPSGAYWWNNFEVVREIQNLGWFIPDLKLYLTVGTNESNDPRWREEAILSGDKLREALERRGFQRGKDFVHLRIDGGTHSQDEWRRQLLPIFASQMWNTPGSPCLTQEFIRFILLRGRNFQ